MGERWGGRVGKSEMGKKWLEGDVRGMGERLGERERERERSGREMGKGEEEDRGYGKRWVEGV